MTDERIQELTALADRCIAIARTPFSKTSEPTAMAGRKTSSTPTARARWDAAVEAELIACRGNKQRAVKLVARRSPALRQQLVSEANASRPTARTQQPTARSATADFSQQVQSMVDGGMDRKEAVKLLSQQMGLSQEPRGTRFVSTRDQYRS